jgi:hypothetical protein
MILPNYKQTEGVFQKFQKPDISLRWDKTSCQRFEASQSRLKMGLLA